METEITTAPQRTDTKRARYDVSLIIISFNIKPLLKKCIQSLIKETEGFLSEIVVVDNGSCDGTSDMIVKEFPKVRLMRSEKYLESAAAYNLAFEKTHSRYVVLLSPDASIDAGSLSKAILKMDGDQKIGMAGGKLVSEQEGWRPSRKLFCFSLEKPPVHTYPNFSFFDVTKNGNALQGGFTIIRRSALEKVGYFDKHFSFHYEELDLCNRMKDRKFTIQYWPDILVKRISHESEPVEESEKIYHQFELKRIQSSFRYFRKYWGVPSTCLVYLIEKTWFQILLFRAKSSAERKHLREMAALLTKAWKQS